MSTILFTNQSTPTAPTSGKLRFYVDTADGILKSIDSSSVIVTYAGVSTEYIQDIVGAFISAGSSKAVVTYNDIGNALTIDVDQTQIDHTQLQNIGTNSHATIDSHIASTSNPHGVTKAQVGLSNADNTSDVNKPISTATQTALNAKVDSSLIGAASGVCPLDGTSKIASTYLPAYVDDVLEYANLVGFPGIGTAGIIYVALDTNKTYRWGGSSYTEISPSPGSTDAVPEGSINLYFTNSRASAAAPVQSVNGNTGAVVLVKADVGLGNVDNTADASKAIAGDVTGTLGASTIANSAVTLAKMANVATSSVFYRKTAGTGIPEVQALSTLKTDLGLTGTNSGDQTITLTGNVTGSGTGSFATTIANNAVSNAMLAQIASATFKGRTTAGTGNVETLTSTQATSILNVMSGDFGAGGTKGLVPAQNIGDAVKFLKGDGTWGVPIGTGDMLSTNNLSDVANTTTARNNILPSKTGNSLKVLRVNSGETDYELATPNGGSGRVWSTSNSGTVNLSSSSDRGLIFTGAVDGRLLNLPNATTMTIGDNFEIINYTDCIIRVLDFGSNKINVIWPGQSVEIYPVDVSSSNGVWVFNNYGNTYNQQPALFDDFISAGTATNTVGNLGWTLTSTSGTGSLVYQAVTNPRMGVLRISTATANNAAVALSLGTTTPIVVGGGRIICEFYANLPSLGGTGAAALTVQIGLQDSTGSSETTNGIYLSYAGTAAGTINWTAKTSSASTRTSTSTGVAAAAGTWVKFTIVINAAGTAVSYYNDDQYLFDITTNIPTAPIAPNIHIFAGASNTAAKSMDIDFYSLTTSSTTIR